MNVIVAWSKLLFGTSDKCRFIKRINTNLFLGAQWVLSAAQHAGFGGPRYSVRGRRCLQLAPCLSACWGTFNITSTLHSESFSTPTVRIIINNQVYLFVTTYSYFTPFIRTLLFIKRRWASRCHSRRSAWMTWRRWPSAARRTTPKSSSLTTSTTRSTWYVWKWDFNF